MRRLGSLLGRGRSNEALELTPSDMRVPGRPAAASGEMASTPQDRQKLDELATAIDHVADYVARLKREIGALKAGELYSERLPAAREDLATVETATKDAVEAIMAAAEAILAADTLDPNYHAIVGERSLKIMEACSFQDLAGQRLSRAGAALASMEKRLERFIRAVRIADSGEVYDREAILREARREILLVAGPQDTGIAIDQHTVDKLFD